MNVVYHESDADLSHLEGSQIAILGYGNLGRPLAFNLRDSNLHVIVGNREDEYAEQAREDKFTIYTIEAAVKQANILIMAMPDEAMSQIYLEQIAPYVKTGDLMIFASAYNIAFQFVEPPIFVDVGLLAPQTLAANIRQAYLEGVGFPSFVSLHQKVSPNALNKLLAVARACGGLKQGALEVTFQQEVELDLFWQQAVLPAIHAILLASAQVLTRAGYPDGAALMELYLSGEMSEFFRQAMQHGFLKTLESMSMTSQYGMLSRTERFQESKMLLQMESILNNIQTGEFAREWSSEYADGYPRLKALQKKLSNTTLWQLEPQVLDIWRRK